MRKLVLVLIAFATSSYVKAQQNYDASLISKDLLPYASAVVRFQQVNIEVKDLENATYHIKQAVTIFNKNGDDMAEIEIAHDKNSSIKYVKGAIYNSAGKLTGKFSESDFEDVNGYDGFSLFQDVKVKHYRPVVMDYPYTVEFEYEKREKQTLAFDDWTPNPWLNTSVEKSTFTFTCKPDFNIHYKEINLPVTANYSTNKDGMKIYNWQVSNIKAIREEPYSPNPEKVLSAVKIVPEKFSYCGLQGNFTNWNELGKWVYDKLISDRQQLPQTTIQYIKDITAGIADPKLKAKKIYEYVQSKTHYVSVQIGIGGQQPFLASDVDQLNYGDCKALVNYTQALLKAVDINSWYCIVTGNSHHKTSMLNDFASMDQGNHIILCIPFKNDTTWMDCTSQTIPFGYLGDFTDDRTALACTPNGGILLHTPRYAPQDNIQQRNASFILNNEGELSGNMTTTFKGAQYDTMDGIISQSYKDQLKYMHYVYPINNMEIQKLIFKQDKSINPMTTENINLKASEYASVTGDKIYFTINPVNRFTKIPKLVRNRATDVYINEGYTDIDEISYSLPSGYHPDTEPLNVNIKTLFGSYTVTSVINGNQLVYKRRLQILDGTYPKDKYQDLVDFYQTIFDTDGSDIILVKNN